MRSEPLQTQNSKRGGFAESVRSSKFGVQSAKFVVLSALFLSACSPAPEPLKKYYDAPHFTLTERSGQPFDSASLRGKVWVADFFFTGCQGTCLVLTQRVAKLHSAFRDEPGVRFVSISTDANNDTPEQLTRYAASFHADARWAFLTGAHDAIFDLSIQGFKLALVEDAAAIRVDEKFIHSTRLVLVDKAGSIRGYYDGLSQDEAETKRLTADIRRLLTE